MNYVDRLNNLSALLSEGERSHGSYISRIKKQGDELEQLSGIIKRTAETIRSQRVEMDVSKPLIQKVNKKLAAVLKTVRSCQKELSKEAMWKIL